MWTWFFQGTRLVQDIGDAPVISGIANSIGTAIRGDDFGDYALVESVGDGVRWRKQGYQASVEDAFESVSSLTNAFTPLSGTARANPELGRSGGGLVSRATLSHRDAHGDGWTVNWVLGFQRWSRIHLNANGHIGLSSGELRLSASVGATFGDPPAYRTFALGGRGTLLGVPFRSMGGRRMALAEIAWAIPVSVPTPPFPYSRLVRLPSTIAPYLAAGVAGGDLPILPWRATGRVEPVAGLRLDLWGPLFRLETGVALRTGKVGVALDIHPQWWPLF